ncbi:MAG: patatin family protein, partial [Lachnospiraceae bacterium]|nr:patatin family protein [Lachnospiraceae bacterium]
LIKTGDLFNVKMCYDTIPNELDPFDYDAFNRCEGKGHVVVTDVVTGRPRYIRLNEIRRDLVAVQASASLPIVSRTVKIGGREYLDGGMADSIPIRKSIHDGHDKNIIVLTRPLGYEKKPTSSMGLIKFIYRNYPGLVDDMKKRHIRYNRTLEYIEQLEADGKVFVFRPESIIKIDRIEKDVKKLKVLYLQGYHDAAINYKLMKEYLES